MSGPSSSFPAFLQARLSNTYASSPRLPQHHYHHHQYHPLRQSQHSNLRTMATQQEADVYGFDIPDVTYGNDNFAGIHDSQSSGPASSMSMNRMQTFEEMARNDTSAVSVLANVSQWQEMQQASQGRLPFRPTLPVSVDPSIPYSSGMNFRSDNMSLGGSFDDMNSSHGGSVGSSFGGLNTSFTGTETMQPLKIDTSVAAATPLSILSTPVDAAQYEIVHDAEWVWSSTDYASSTQSSDRTESTGPRTPLSPHSADSTQSSFFNSRYPGSPTGCAVAKVEGAGADMFASTMPRSLLMSCPCTGCAGPASTHQSQQLADTWSFDQAQASYLATVPTYGSTSSSGHLPTFGYTNHGQTNSLPFVPRQTSPPATSSLMDLERQSSETTEGESDESESESDEPNVNDQAITEATHRQKRDSFLLNMRRQNYSYKDIKELGNFREAESTLRGRVRVLTKDKSERVRKPTWDSNDVSFRLQLNFYVDHH